MYASPEPLDFVASAPRGLADLLRAELEGFGAEDARDRSSGVAFRGRLEVAYRACFASRIANRVLLEIARFQAQSAEELYRAVRGLDWTRHLGPGATLACGFSGRHPEIVHTHFGALKVKDAVCDALREQAGVRPDVARERPSVRLHAHARGEHVTLSIDLAGESLHRRGYRIDGGEAPLKENVAAGVLLRAGWGELCERGAAFLDPLCGSGTLVIEAAMIAGNIPPGRLREYYGFLGWRGHDEALWRSVREAAEAAIRPDPAAEPSIVGRDRDVRAIHMARRNAERAGVSARTAFEVGPLAEAHPPAALGAHGSRADGSAPLGLLCTNPPYGVRLADQEAALEIHRELGAVLRERFRGWQAAILTGAPQLGRQLGIRAHRTHTLWNGALECRLLRLTVEEASLREPGRLAKGDVDFSSTPGARMFANRLAKNLKRLGSWARRTGVSCYRLYDADMPEYAFAIDLYRTRDPQSLWLHVQEYAAPAEIELEAVRRRRAEVLATLPEVTAVPRECIRVRTRRRGRRGEQYAKLGEAARTHVVEEGGLAFEVNFDDYLDTGLFLDQRLTRARLRSLAGGKRFLNLFAYTGAATVYAAAGGAASTTSVDLSRTYLEWARRNLALNGLEGPRHTLVRADCLEWLRERVRERERYDLIYLDPPTFSNSKRMQSVLDVARDHPQLIEGCAALLAPDGLLVFCTNAQRFDLEESVSGRFDVREFSAASLPLDFERNPRIHRSFEVRLRGASGTSSGRHGLPSRSSI